jgi:hypothetical protein
MRKEVVMTKLLNVPKTPKQGRHSVGRSESGNRR